MTTNGASNLAQDANKGTTLDAARGNPEAIWKLVMAMKLCGIPKESLDFGFMANFEIEQFAYFWALSYVELCKRSTLRD